MHWVIPFAGALSPAAAEAASSLALPHLERLLALLTPTARDEGDAYALSPPHERALAAAWGWSAAPDGLLPMAAQAARGDGLAPADDGRGWGLLSPTHWHLGTDQVSLLNPAELALPEDDARTLFEALQPLLAEDGFELLWGAPGRWYLVHPRLATLPTASIDRVIGRNVDLWLNSHPDARLLRRLQAEAQMLWHSHALNAAREARGLLPVNSFWLSGTGRPAPAAAATDLVLADGLRAPALAEDWAAWAEAWTALDAGPLARARQAAEAGDAVVLTLCGERHAQRHEARPRRLRQRWFGPRGVAALPVLQAL
jgi:hypothetical protein